MSILVLIWYKYQFPLGISQALFIQLNLFQNTQFQIYIAEANNGFGANIDIELSRYLLQRGPQFSGKNKIKILFYSES